MAPDCATINQTEVNPTKKKNCSWKHSIASMFQEQSMIDKKYVVDYKWQPNPVL